MMSMPAGCWTGRVAASIVVAAAWVGATMGVAAGETPTQPTAILLSLDHPVDAVAAPFVLALTRGFYGAERINVSTNIANGALDAIARVASGASDVALTDVNTLIRYRDKADAVPIKAVLMLQNSAGYAIIARKNRGIRTLADMTGKTLGVAEGDLSIRYLPAVANASGVSLKAIRQESISDAVREPLLSSGQIDAVTALSYRSGVNVKDRGVQADDLTVLRFADYGCEAYGLAIVANPKFAAARPDALKSFVRAVIAGTRLAVKSPAMAIDDVLSQMDGASRDLEMARLHALIDDTILTEEAKRDGFGGIEMARFDKSIAQIGEGYKFRKRPSAADIFDAEFLPPREERTLD